MPKSVVVLDLDDEDGGDTHQLVPGDHVTICRDATDYQETRQAAQPQREDTDNDYTAVHVAA